jgi:hypothetical protein
MQDGPGFLREHGYAQHQATKKHSHCHLRFHEIVTSIAQVILGYRVSCTSPNGYRIIENTKRS